MEADPEDVAIGRRLRKVIEKRGLQIKEAARIAGIAEKTMHRWLGGAASADAKGLSRLAAHLDTTIDYLVTGIGAESGDWETHLPPPPEGLVRIELYDISLSAGPGAEALDRPPTSYAELPASFIRRFGSPNELALFPTVGDSMEPDIKDGELVMIDRSIARPRDGVVMARLGKDLVIKRMRILGGGKAELVSANELYPPIRVDLHADDFEVIGKAVWAGRAM